MIGWEELKEVLVKCTGCGALIGAVLSILYWCVCWVLYKLFHP